MQVALTATEPAARVAALSDLFPVDPPDEWFHEVPAWFTPGMKLTVVTDGPEAGRVAATVADRRTYILGGGGKWQPPKSPNGYDDAMQGDTYTAAGHVVRTANLSADLDHIDGRASFEQARDAMANTGTALARVRYMDVGNHIVALGAAWPGLTDVQVRKMQAFPLSGDWRWREEFGRYAMAGAIFVNNPGLPLPSRPIFQPVALAASLGDPHPAIFGGWVCDDEGVCTMPPTTEPTLTLTLTATETARLHELLTGPQVAAVGACSCQGAHAAAVGDEALSPAVGEDAGAPVTRAEFDALVQQVEEVRGQVMADALDGVDSMVAAMPLPPDLDGEQFRMPLTAAFDETKVRRTPKGNEGGGRFTFKVERMQGNVNRVTLEDPDGNMVNRRKDVGDERVEAVKRQLATEEGLDRDDIVDAA